MATTTEAKVIERSDPVKFEADLNFYLSEGWQVIACSCGFVNSEKYDFCADYKAVLTKKVVTVENRAGVDFDEGFSPNESPFK